MASFSIEALRAQHGDCLLVHFGGSDSPQLIVIDGGPSLTFGDALGPRLEQLRAERRLASLPIEIIIATHLDEDHILGLIRLCDALLDGTLSGPRIEPATLWHNTFGELMVAGAEAAGDDEFVLAAVFASPTDLPRGGLDAVIASIPQGERLQEKAAMLQWPINEPFGGLVRSDGPEGNRVALDGLELTVLGPNASQLEKLRDAWPKEAAALERFAAKPDDSAFNLSSIVCLLESQGRRALMTGDALGADILGALEHEGLIEPDARMELDLLKVPHHGSDHNSTPEFFSRLPADHYLISGNGKYGNPDLSTLRMLLDARLDDQFTLHLTYQELIAPAGSGPIDFLIAQKRGGRRFGLEFRDDRALSLRVDLAP